MKSIGYVLIQFLFFGVVFHSVAQNERALNGMESKKENLTHFRVEKRENLDLSIWRKLNPPTFYNHPEFGKLPNNAPCVDCVEILDRRTSDYRYFIDANDHQKFYIQKSLGAINFLENNTWLAKDVALKLVSSGVYESRKSEQKVGVDVQNKRTYIVTSAGKIYFNQWQLLGIDDNVETMLSEANWDSYTIGEDGAKINNIFPDVDAEIIVNNGSVKTNFIVNKNNYNQYEKLIFRDAMSANQSVSFNFKHSNDLLAAGEMDVKLNGQSLLEISEGIAYPESGDKNQLIVLNYKHVGNTYDVIVPVDWIKLNVNNGPLVIDPLVTGTATLAQAAINGSMYNASCNFDNSCDYPLTVPTPAQAVFTDVRFSFNYIAQGGCYLQDGATKIQIGSCISPSPTNTFWYCNSPNPGTCNAADISVFSEVASCLPAPSCVSQNVVMTLKLYRRCKGASGCSNTCIGANSPFVGVIEGKTLEFVNLTTPITIAASICQNGSLNASADATAGVAPITYNWSFSPSGTPSFGSTSAVLINFPTAGNQTVYVTSTDACGNTDVLQQQSPPM